MHSPNRSLSKADLMCIDAEDILKSRVFSDEEELTPEDAEAARKAEAEAAGDDG
ncbi:MAG: hypothetical protein ABR540_05315 [Acidimicrobiales bacterium]|nr:hypothetical protein [Actinomycetota bacterium]